MHFQILFSEISFLECTFGFLELFFFSILFYNFIFILECIFYSEIAFPELRNRFGNIKVDRVKVKKMGCRKK